MQNSTRKNTEQPAQHSGNILALSFICMNCSKSHKVPFCFDLTTEKWNNEEKNSQLDFIFCILNCSFWRRKINFITKLKAKMNKCKIWAPHAISHIQIVSQIFSHPILAHLNGRNVGFPEMGFAVKFILFFKNGQMVQRIWACISVWKSSELYRYLLQQMLEAWKWL